MVTFPFNYTYFKRHEEIIILLNAMANMVVIWGLKMGQASDSGHIINIPPSVPIVSVGNYCSAR